MFLKRFLLVVAAVLIITSETTAKELASNHESEVKGAKYAHAVVEYYKGGLGVGGFINRKLKQAPIYESPGYPTCCAAQAEATGYKQAHEAQPHNK